MYTGAAKKTQSLWRTKNICNSTEILYTKSKTIKYANVHNKMP